MKFPRFLASGAVRETGLVRAQDIGALTNVGDAEFRATEQAGRAVSKVSDIAHRAFMSRRALDDTIESGKATQRVQESWNQAEESVDNFNPAHDLPLPGDPKYLETLTTFGTTERDGFLQSSLSDIEKDATKIFSGIRNPKTKAQLVKQYNDFYADRTKNLKGKLSKVLDDYQIDEMGKLARAAAVGGDMESSDFYVNKMAEHGLITNVNATRLKATFNELSVRSQATELSRIGLYDEARRIITDSTIGVIEKASFGNMIDAAENRAIANAKKRNEVRVEEQKDILGKALQNNTITYDMIDNMDALDEGEQEQYRIKMNTEAARAAKGPPIFTNQSVKGGLEDEAYKIWQGAREKPDYDEMLSDARYGNSVDGKQQYTFGGLVSSNPLIDDEDYDSLRTLGATELKTSQAKGLSEAMSYGKGQLVEVTNELDFAAILRSLKEPQKEQAKSERKIQLENWSQFNRSMKLWQQENPDAVEGDYYIESRRKLPLYHSRTPEEIGRGVLPEALLIEPLTEEELKGGMTDLIAASTGPLSEVDAITGAEKRAPTDVDVVAKPRQNTQKIQMQAPNGSTVTVNAGQLGRLLDLGYRFPVESNVQVKRNTTEKNISFGGLDIKPNKRIISYDGGVTWQMLR